MSEAIFSAMPPLQTVQSTVIAPKTHKITFLDREFTLTAMPEQVTPEELKNNPKLFSETNWVDLRLGRYWRQHIVFRQITSTIAGAAVEHPEIEQELKRDQRREERITQLTKEWVEINNILVAKALKLDDTELEIVRKLSNGEKIQIIAIQDSLNGLDIWNRLEELEKQISENKIPTLPGIKQSKLTKKQLRKYNLTNVEKQIRKSGKKQKKK